MAPLPLGRWKVSFEVFLDSGKSKSSPGFLLLWPRNWLVLVNHKDSPVVGKHLKDGEVFFSGSIIRFQSHVVFVEACLLSPPGFSSFPEAPPVRWRASYADLVPHSGVRDSKPDLNRQAFLILKPHAKRLVFLDSKEQVLDARFLLVNEKVNPGQLLDLNIFTVLVGDRVLSDSIEHALQRDNSCTPNSYAEVVSGPVTKHVNNPFLPSEAFKGLDFEKGKVFANDCIKKFGQRVNLDKFSSRKPFFLVCSFCRATFRLDVHTVALALQACFGGIAALYNVRGLRDRSFRFSVSSSDVGFEIYNQGALAQSSFKIFFNLWGQGGPNWTVEEKKFYKEQDKEWTEVRSKFVNRKSAVPSSPPAQKVSRSHRILVFERLEHPTAASTVTNFGQNYGEFKDPFNGQINEHYSTGQRYFHNSSNQPTRFYLGAKLPGFLSAFKFPSFPSLPWPDSSYQNWFKAHGPAPQIQQVTSFGDFSFSQKQVAATVLRVASSTSSSLSPP
jgi:hypothetical protein